MLELRNITKRYEIGKKKNKTYQVVHALKGINLSFRKNEFVSILGPSGCGKTTLLNIVGGLDQYTSGDLVINNKSTKKFKNSDWDTYRNHSVGFVFQSYNLISHQSVLSNVELALTLSGISKDERRKRAKEVLKKVGLEDQINKKPNQLSGGQMQRVAIARALVNDPEIILADEPTGALDSKTSVQIMELLKEISKDKLIIMVTHNPELAETYSTRIIKLLDGKITDDSNPYVSNSEDNKKEDKVISVASDEELTKNQIKKRNKLKRMSFFTALSLSFKNLLTKKARTSLVAFAGSIGIIGIALVLALSSGFNGYINKVQEDSLSSYPIIIQEQSFNATSLMMSMMMDSSKNSNHGDDEVYSSETVTQLFNKVTEAVKPNDIKNFYKYLQENYKDIEENISAIAYTYNLDFDVYTSSNTMVYPKSNSLYDVVLKYAIKYFEINANVLIEKQDIKYIIKKNPEMALNEAFISGYLGEDALSYIKNNEDGMPLSKQQLSNIIDKFVFGSLAMGGGFSIETMFKDYNIGAFNEIIDNQELIESQYDLVAGTWMKNKNDVLLVLDKNNEVDDYILYALGIISEEEMDLSIEKAIKSQEATISKTYDEIVGGGVSTNYKIMLGSDYYNDSNKDLDSSSLTYIDDLRGSISDLNGYINNNSIDVRICGIIRANDVSSNTCLTPGIVYSTDLTDYLIEKHNSSQAVEDSKMATIQKDNPTSLSIYVKDFDSKNSVKKFIEKYNSTRDDESKEITYDDTVDVLMGSISTIINAITYVLVAFVSISLIVSSIMIGIITYISVIERTKEIGVLRSVGASKKDVKRVFTAESLIIGFLSGVFGILVTIILSLPITLILNKLAGIAVVVKLPWVSAIVLMLISMLLTFIAGLIPARIASKKDPVVALRTE